MDGPAHLAEHQRLFGPVYAPQRDPASLTSWMTYSSLWVNLFPTLLPGSSGQSRDEDLWLEASGPPSRALLAAARLHCSAPGGNQQGPPAVGDMGNMSLLGRCWLGHPPASPHPEGFHHHSHPPECLFRRFSMGCFLTPKPHFTDKGERCSLNAVQTLGNG